MAQIDFSNAQIEMQSLPGNYEVISQQYLWLYDQNWWASDGNAIYPTKTIIENTPTKYSARFQGTIPSNASGGNFISIAKDNLVVYKITGITYGGGDTFDCTIETEITVV